MTSYGFSLPTASNCGMKINLGEWHFFRVGLVFERAKHRLAQVQSEAGGQLSYAIF